MKLALHALGRETLAVSGQPAGIQPATTIVCDGERLFENTDHARGRGATNPAYLLCTRVCLPGQFFTPLPGHEPAKELREVELAHRCVCKGSANRLFMPATEPDRQTLHFSEARGTRQTFSIVLREPVIQPEVRIP